MSFWLNGTFHSGHFSNASEACDVFGYSFSVKICVLLIFSIILLSSLVGNALLIVIVYKRKELRKTTNYFIVNMAFSDFVYPLTVIPIRLAQIASSSMQWPIGGVTGLFSCKAISFLRRASFTVSTGSLLCIALDRFVAVVFPMKVPLISSRSRTFVIGLTWILAVIMSSVDAYAHELVKKNGEIICTYLKSTSFSFKLYDILRSALFVIGPVIAVTVLYCVIAMTLRKQDKTLRGSSVHQKDKRKQQAIKMTLCVIAAFYICNIPFMVMYVLDESQCSFSKELWALSRVLFNLSSTVNPVICITFVQSYRQGFKETTMGWKKCLTTRRNMEKGKPKEIALQDIRIIPEIGENLAFSDS
ncbi:QRFP-like peptide receptor [Oculina patagonica]